MYIQLVETERFGVTGCPFPPNSWVESDVNFVPFSLRCSSRQRATIRVVINTRSHPSLSYTMVWVVRFTHKKNTWNLKYAPEKRKGRKCIHQPPNHWFPWFLVHHLDFVSEHLHLDNWPHLTKRHETSTAGRQRHRQGRLHYREQGESLCCGLFLTVGFFLCFLGDVFC